MIYSASKPSILNANFVSQTENLTVWPLMLFFSDGQMSLIILLKGQYFRNIQHLKNYTRAPFANHQYSNSSQRIHDGIPNKYKDFVNIIKQFDNFSLTLMGVFRFMYLYCSMSTKLDGLGG